MRHRVDHRKLGRTASHRRAMMRSMVTSLFLSERITTTAPKAKEARRVAERLITRAKKGYRAHQEGLSLKSSGKDGEAKRLESVALGHWRRAGRVVRSVPVLRKLFDEIAPLYLERNGGYTRIIRLDQMRVGDNARMVLLELVDSEVTKKPLVRGAGVPEAEAEAAKKPKGRGKKEKAEEGAETAGKPTKDKKAKAAKEESPREKGAKERKDAKGKRKASGSSSKPASKSSPKAKSKKPGE
jgi:large subunit ribosomal protein L17